MMNMLFTMFLSRSTLPATALALWAASVPAQSQVIEVQDNGVAVTRAGAAVTTADATMPIVISGPERGLRAVQTSVAAQVAPAPMPTSALNSLFASAAHDFGVDQRLIHAVAWHESRFRQTAVSNKGAIGVMQLMPGTARALGVNPADIVQNIRGGTALLGRLLRQFGGDVRLTLAAYNAGAGSVQRYGGVPPFRETQAYVADIMQRLGS